MKKVITATLFLILIALIPVSSFAMSCNRFNSIGYEVNGLDQVVNTKATTAQIKVFKKIVSDYVGVIDNGKSSHRKKVLRVAFKNKRLAEIMAGSLMFTRAECFRAKKDDLKTTVIAQFNYLLDSYGKNL